MKALALWIFVLSFICFSSANIETAKNTIKKAARFAFDKKNLDTCKAETGMTDEDKFNEEDIKNEVYKQPENEERKRRVGNTLVCIFHKDGFMVGSDIKEDKFHDEISKHLDDDIPLAPKLHKMVHDCIKEANHLKDDYEKAFTLFVCARKQIEEIKESLHTSANEHLTNESSEKVQE